MARRGSAWTFTGADRLVRGTYRSAWRVAVVPTGRGSRATVDRDLAASGSTTPARRRALAPNRGAMAWTAAACATDRGTAVETADWDHARRYPARVPGPVESAVRQRRAEMTDPDRAIARPSACALVRHVRRVPKALPGPVCAAQRRPQRPDPAVLRRPHALVAPSGHLRRREVTASHHPRPASRSNRRNSRADGAASATLTERQRSWHPDFRATGSQAAVQNRAGCGEAKTLSGYTFRKPCTRLRGTDEGQHPECVGTP